MDTLFKPLLKNILGKLAMQAFPRKTERIQHTETFNENSLLDRIVRAGLIRNMRDNEKISQIHQRYWAGDGGTQFAATHGYLFDRLFLAKHCCIVEEIEKLISLYPGKYKHVFEIGCGDGQVINFLSDRLKTIEFFTGVDINHPTILKNNAIYKKDNLRFVCANAAEWLCQHGKSRSIFVSNGGVLEYFSTTQINALLKTLTTFLKPSAFAIVEPLAKNYNLETETSSRPYGNEWSFSHNYIRLFESHGFVFLYKSEIITEQTRWLLALCTT